MPPKTPKVETLTWRELYAAAQRVQELKPWEMLDDLDLVVVRDPSSGQTGYGVFMGSGGEIFGYAVYRGSGGFSTYRNLIDEKAEINNDNLLELLDCLKLEFGARSELQAEDLAVIRSLGLSFKGNHAWPGFRSFIPGYAPWFITEAEARFLTLCIQAGCYHFDRVNREEIDESFREGAYLVYSPAPDPPGFQSSWEKWPEDKPPAPVKPILNLKAIEGLRSLTPDPHQSWEADVFLFPSQILEGDRPYFPRMGVVCHESSGIIVGTELSPPGQASSQLIVDLICSTAAKNGALPGALFVKGTAEEVALAPLAKMLGFTVRRRKRLGKIEKFRNAAMEGLR